VIGFGVLEVSDRQTFRLTLWERSHILTDVIAFTAFLF